MDNWAHRSSGMRCGTCMWWIVKVSVLPVPTKDCEMKDHGPRLGRCRRRAPTLGGWPPLFETDWCGDHKLDETKI